VLLIVCLALKLLLSLCHYQKKPTIKVHDKKIPYRCPAVELGFAIMYHTLQGKTLDYLILNLNKRGCQPEVNLMSLLVGLLQVYQSFHVRILPPSPGTGLNPLLHLTNLKSDSNFRIWCAGFDSKGIWSVDGARLAAEAGRPIRTRVLQYSIVPVPIPAPQPGAVPLDQHQNQMELHSIRSAKQDDIYGASNIVLPCPSS
jgi:hypothetical protein